MKKKVIIAVILMLFQGFGIFSLKAQTYATLPFTDDFESGSLGASWATVLEGTARNRVYAGFNPHAGTYQMILDDGTDAGATQTSEAWLHLDLTGETVVELIFWMQDMGDENNTGVNGDGIFFSDDDGVSFTEVQHLDGTAYTNGTWTKFILDVDALCTTYGLTLASSTFIIKFEQRDNYGATSSTANDGIGFDDISVSTTVTPLTRYAIADGAWNTSGTWSYTSGGGTCSCTPTSTSEVHIENTFDVTISTTSANCKDLTIYSGGTLDLIGGDDLYVYNGGTVTVNSGGTFTGTATNERLNFMTHAGTYGLVVNQATGVDVGEIYIFSDLTLNISGSGSITTRDDFEFREADATVNNDLTGTLTVTDNINYAFGETNADRNTFVNNQTISAPDGLVFDGDDDIFTNTGTITIGTNFEGISATNTGCAITNSGTMTIPTFDVGSATVVVNNTGIIDWNGVCTNCGSFTVNNNAAGIINWSGSSTPGGTYNLSTATSTFNYDRGGAQTIFLPDDNDYANLTISNSGTKSTSYTPVDINGNLIISGTAVLDAGTGLDDITLAGNWNNTGGTFTEGVQTVTFDGGSAQTFTNSTGTETFCNVAINKSANGLLLNDKIDILSAGTMTFTQGIVTSSTGNEVQFQDGALTNGGDTDSFVDGPVLKIGNDAFTFPTGDGMSLGNIGISAPSVSVTFTAEYTKSAHGDTDVEAALSHKSLIEYWDLSPSAGTTADVILYWDVMANHGIDNSTDLTVAHYDGATDWDEPDATPVINFVDPGSATANSVSTWSPFTFGSKSGGGTVNPLPVELLNFSAVVREKGVEIYWTTATEINNDLFSVERSMDGEIWEVAGIVQGAGNNYTELNYSFYDNDPSYGTSYYRLRQTDFDGKNECFNIVAVGVNAPDNFEMMLLPNPACSGEAKLLVSSKGNHEILVVVYDMVGAMQYSKVLVKQEGDFIVAIDKEGHMKSGTYVVIASDNQDIIQKKLIIR
ncbi:MAG: T9SS type A sorting domain-containing protein [Flavobacteriales bacterium]|nr:T9SS type A sorting domain-containing protein [Flavobacteriales bacterium]